MVCRPGHENDPVEKLRHSAAHVMASAVQELFPGTKVTIGPVIDDGFFYDFDAPAPFSPADLVKIEEKMREISGRKLAFERKAVSRDEALRLFREKGEKFKLEIIEGLPVGEEITLYSHGDWVDLCKGPHVESTGELRHFKLLSVAGAYWRGIETNPMLQRIYGTAFASEAELNDYLKRREEAEKRDHRKLGQELDLFLMDPLAPGSPFFLPKGALIYNLLIDFMRGLYRRHGYQEVITPQVLSTDLWIKSGHYAAYKENMFPFMKIEAREFGLKPMNCPAHAVLYSSRLHSYRELPVRYADFGRLHRFERSGVLHGLTRVRSFSQDDAHIFCRPDQIESEIASFIQMVLSVYRIFRFDDLRVHLSLRPEKSVGTDSMWQQAETALKKVLKENRIECQEFPGEGAFYGPKIDFIVKDAVGREWQLGTVQLDYSLPERFDLKFVGEDGTKARPVVIHRALLGSLERFFGILVEHYGGAFPVWLAPVQARVITISEDQKGYAQEISSRLNELGIRGEPDLRNEKLGGKIRDAELQKVPYMLVIGKREAQEGKVNVRGRGQGDLGAMGLDDFIARVRREETEGKGQVN